MTGSTINAAGAGLYISGGSSATFTGNVTNSGTFQTGIWLGSGGKNTVTIKGALTNTSGATLQLVGPDDVLKVTGTTTNAAGANLLIG